MEIKERFNTISGKSNNPEIEQEYRATRSLYEGLCSASNQSLSENYQKYLNQYHRITSLYLFGKENQIPTLIIYNTENEREEVKFLDTSELFKSTIMWIYDFDWASECFGTANASKLSFNNSHLIQLPNDEFFCYGSYPPTGLAFIIDRNYNVRKLPSGKLCSHSSGIYFNNNVYCFGGCLDTPLPLSRKFDFNKNRWINLVPMPYGDYLCSIVIFNGNILIAGSTRNNLLLYSIEINSFSIIPYEFAQTESKILINVERLYCIEICIDGWIYESEDEYNWKQISKSNYGYRPGKAYGLYNKGGIYVAISLDLYWKVYYKFDLKEKTMVELK